MADLFDRLFPASVEEENIAVHSFAAAIIDYMAGETTRAQIISYWSLDTEARNDLNGLCDAIDALGTQVDKIRFALEFDAVMLMAAHGAKYTTKSAFKTRLGI
jgi:hypothetical protein